MTRRLALLIGSSLAFWVVMAYPALLLWGQSAVVCSGVAMAVCLLPAALTLAWSEWALRSSPDQQLVLVMGGMAVRMAVVLGASLALWSMVPCFQRPSFWLWILVSYLFTLALEMGLMLSGHPAAKDS